METLLFLLTFCIFYNGLAHAAANDSGIVYTMRQRREVIIASSVVSPTYNLSVKDIGAWTSTQGHDGRWSDTEINYTSGCGAQRAVWPAYTHWRRLLMMSAAWRGGLKGAEQWSHSRKLRTSVSSGMQWWFDNDFHNEACVDAGGTDACPCGTPGLWNSNWFSSIILIPDLVGQTCLLLQDSLAEKEMQGCVRMTTRSFVGLNQQGGIPGLGALNGANLLDVVRVTVDLGLLTSNFTILDESYRRAHKELSIREGIMADGILPDGSFGQHEGILYNGNYGKDYGEDVLSLETIAASTKYQANENQQDAVNALFDANRWMIYRNTRTGVLHWDFSVLGRMLTYAVSDRQATSGIFLDLNSAKQLGQAWGSDTLTEFGETLTQRTPSANAGFLTGNKMFSDSDYMVHRGEGFVSSLKMYSKRTRNSECLNDQNPFGFHLSDGARYTYTHGNEYEDIFAAWDWSLIPGITTDYNSTILQCDPPKGFQGLRSFVGGVSNGAQGIGAMKYMNPSTNNFGFQKAWFFFRDKEHVIVSNISSLSQGSTYSVLDQKRRNGTIWVNDEEHFQDTGAVKIEYPGVQSLWHDNIGYSFPQGNSAVLALKAGQTQGVWSTIGPSTAGATQVDMFAAWLHHENRQDTISYTVYPGMSRDEFREAASDDGLVEISHSEELSAVFDPSINMGMFVFWVLDGGSVDFNVSNVFNSSGDTTITLQVNKGAAIILDIDAQELTVSDPLQQVDEAAVVLGYRIQPDGNNTQLTQGNISLTFDFSSQANKNGGSVTQKLLVTRTNSTDPQDGGSSGGDSGNSEEMADDKDKSRPLWAIGLALGLVALLICSFLFWRRRQRNQERRRVARHAFAGGRALPAQHIDMMKLAPGSTPDEERSRGLYSPIQPKFDRPVPF